MCTNWMGFTLKAILLASLALFLFGCGGGRSTDPPAVKSVSGVVSDSTAGQLQLSANATVTAYAVDANGNVSSIPLSNPVKSDAQGKFSLTIPASYTGVIMLKSVKRTTSGELVVRSLLASVPQNQPVTISPATEMVAQYIVINKSGKFTSDNIQKAILVLEPFFGPNFTQVLPPATGIPLTQPQLQLLTATQAIESLILKGTYTLEQLVTVNDSGTIAMGTGPILTAVNNAIAVSYIGLLNVGAITGDIPPPVAIEPVPPEPTNLSDTTAPTAPQNLAASATTGSVTLSWGAATDAVGVTAYYVYRNNILIGTTAKLTFTDSTLSETMTYTYQVKARDAVGNVSTGSNTVDVTTKPIQTYTISGRITSNGSGLPSIYVAITGTGTGVVITDANGGYAISGVRAGNYTLTPAFSGYTFTPPVRSTVVTTANITGIDFTAAAVTPGTVVGGVTYPSGTIIGGITYPTGTVIGGITYPTATVIGGITYPTGTVIGGITYPNGVVIGGVSYPAGTVVGGIAFPLGTVTTAFTLPSGTVIGGIAYPNGTVTGGIIYPSGTAIGTVTYPSGMVTAGIFYPAGAVIAGVIYPAGSLSGSVTYPSGSVTGGVTYPPGTIVGGITYPSGAVIGGITYPTATVIGGITYPTGTVIGGITYPNGVVIGGVSYPAGTVVGGIAFPLGTVTTNFTVPSGTVIGGIIYPNGTVTGNTIYPAGTAIGTVTYPSGTITGGVLYPAGTIIGGTLYPSGLVIGGTTYPVGTIIGGITYPAGTISPLLIYLDVIVSGKVSIAGTDPLVGLPGVTVNIYKLISANPDIFESIPIASTVTGLFGDYRVGVASSPDTDISYTITPKLTGYKFEPLTWIMPISANFSGNKSGINFAGAPVVP